LLDENEIEFVVENSDLLLDTMSRIETQQNLESVEYFCTTLKNLTVNNELICFISEKKPFQLLKNMFKHLLQVCSFSLLHIKKLVYFQLKDQTEYQDQLSKCLTPVRFCFLSMKSFLF